MNVIHSVEDNNSQVIHVSVNSNDRGATGEKGDSVVDVKITDTNHLETTLSNGQTIDSGAVPAIKTRRVFVADMDGVKRTYILPLNIESSQVSYILMNGVVYSDGYVLQSGEITLNYDDLPSGRLEVVINDNSGDGGTNVTINGKAGDIKLKTINGASLDGDGDIELATLDALNNEARTREEADNNLRNSLTDHEARISNNESAISSHSNNLSSLNANISSVNNQMAVLTDDMHEVTDNYVPKTRRINDKFLSHDMRLTADDVEALPITAGITHPVRGELVVNGRVTAEKATQDNHLVTKAQLDAKVAEVVNSAPETLDTLEELSKALGDDPNFATTIANKIGTVNKKIDNEINKLANKVEANTEDLKTTKEKANANSTNISLLNSTVATNKLSSDTQFSNVAKEQDEQNNLISDILNAFSKESDKGTNFKLNTSATKVLGVTIYGNTEQKKYTGKNLINISKSTESNGINFSVDNNYIKAVGTATQNWIVLPFSYFNLAPGVYTLSRDGQKDYRISIDSNYGGNHSIAGLDWNKSSSTFSVSAQERSCYLVYIVPKNTKINITARIMIESGDTATDYEPYTGGVTNLYDCVYGLPVTVDGLTLKQKDGMIECTGTTTNDNVRFQEKLITDLLENNTAYSVYADTPTANLRLTVRLKRKDNNGYEYYNTIDNQVSVFTWNTAVYSEAYIYLVTGEKAFWNGSNSVLSRFGLFKSSSFDGNDYAPVGMNAPTFGEIKGVQDITVFAQGKNLFDTRFGERTINGVSIKTYSDGSFELNGTPTNGFSLTNVFGSKSYVPSGRYKIKVEIISGSVQKVEPSATFLCVYTIQLSNTGSNSEYVREADIVAGNIKEFTNTVNGPKSDRCTPYIWIPYHIENKRAFYSYKNLRMRATLVPNGENTDFVEFDSNTISANLPTLYKVGGYQDYITMRNDKWYLMRNTEIKTLSGSENWFKTGEKKNIFICNNIINSTANYVDGYCTHSSNAKSYPQKDKQFAIRGDGKNLCFLNMATTSITAFKNWLSTEAAKNSPVRIFYPLSSPTEEEIIDSTLLTELKKLMEMRTYDGTTNISITGTGLTPEIKVKYMRKIEE